MSDRLGSPESVAEPPELAVLVADAFAGRPGGVELARRYAGHLATSAVERGLVGPREIPRLWERHVVNCAVVAALLPRDARVIDVGSGAGLPGIPLAIADPRAEVVLVESLERRVAWLRAVVADLGLSVEVVRGRAEDLGPRGSTPLPPAAVVTARAVAPLGRLATWCLPLLVPGGELLALKGRTAGDELAAAAAELRRLGASRSEVVTVGAGRIPVPTTVVRVTLGMHGRTVRREDGL